MSASAEIDSELAEEKTQPTGSHTEALADAQRDLDIATSAANAAKLAFEKTQRAADKAAQDSEAADDDEDLREDADDAQRAADDAWEIAEAAVREVIRAGRVFDELRFDPHEEKEVLGEVNAVDEAQLALIEAPQNKEIRSGAEYDPHPEPRSEPHQATTGAVPPQMFPPCTIVRNLIDHLFRYRGLELAARGLAPDGIVPNFTDDRIIGDMDRFQYTRIDARRITPRGKRDWVVFLVLNGGKYSRHSPDLRKLLGGIETEGAAKAEKLDELIIVAEDDFFTRKALVDLISDLQIESAARRVAAKSNTIDPTGTAAFYNAYPYRNFSVIVPEHQGVSPHIIMTPDESTTFLAEFYMMRTDLPAIYASDPPLVWLGAGRGI